MNTTKRKIARRKSVCGLIAILHIFLVIGTVGSMELERIGITQGFWQSGMLLAGAFLFAWLSGGFDNE